MLEWFKEAALQRQRIPTPPLLPRRLRRELEENFRWIDRDRKGYITYRDLIESDLVDADMAKELVTRYDTDGSGSLDCDEFLMLLCPDGFRAHRRAVRAVTEDG